MTQPLACWNELPMAACVRSCLGLCRRKTVPKFRSRKSRPQKAPSRAQRSDTQLAADDRRYLAAEDFYGVQHFFVRQRRDTHLECDAGDAAENLVHVKQLFCDRFRVANEQRAGRSADGVKLSACGGWPAAFLADFGKRVGIAWKKDIRSLFRGVGQKANGMETYGELLGRMTGATPGLAIEVYKGPEAPGFTADDG